MAVGQQLQQHLLAHTNAKLGLFFAEQTIEVSELIELCADVCVTPTLSAEAEVTPELSAGLYLDERD